MNKNTLEDNTSNISLDEEKIEKETKAQKSTNQNPNSTEEKLLHLENTEDIIKYSHLLLEVNRLLRYTSILKNETKFLNKIRGLLYFNDSLGMKIFEQVMESSPNFLRIKAKVDYLRSVYESISHHRAFLLDYAVMYLGAILHHMKIVKNLDYRRVLYIRNQISKCKSIVINCIKEGCPNICKKYKEKKYNFLYQDLPSDTQRETEEVMDKVVKKVKTN